MHIATVRVITNNIVTSLRALSCALRSSYVSLGVFHRFISSGFTRSLGCGMGSARMASCTCAAAVARTLRRRRAHSAAQAAGRAHACAHPPVRLRPAHGRHTALRHCRRHTVWRQCGGRRRDRGARLLVEVLDAVGVQPGVDPGLEVCLVLLGRLILRAAGTRCSGTQPDGDDADNNPVCLSHQCFDGSPAVLSRRRKRGLFPTDTTNKHSRPAGTASQLAGTGNP